MSSAPTDIDLAAHAYEQAKTAEDQARAARLAAEEHLLDLVGLKGDEGTKSVKTDWYKVSTVAKLTRSIDRNKAGELRPLVDEATFYSVFVPELKLSVSGLKKLATANPDAYRTLLGAVVTKPAKASVKVELIQQEEAA